MIALYVAMLLSQAPEKVPGYQSVWAYDATHGAFVGLEPTTSDIKLAMDLIASWFPETPDVMDGLVIVLGEPKAVHEACGGRPVSCYLPAKKFVLVTMHHSHNGCLAQTSLLHELLHAAHHSHYDLVDYGHVMPVWTDEHGPLGTSTKLLKGILCK